METRRWINHSLPQTLANAVLLLYINAAFAVLFGGFGPIAIAIAAATLAAGWGIANERRWGYQLGILMAFLPVVVRFAFGGLDDVLGASIISLMFEIVLIALLLHPQSRDHQRIWFS